MTKRQIEEAARLFGILADDSRLLILKTLLGGEKSVSELVEICQLSQANVSKHLTILSGGYFVKRRKAGNFVFYSIADPLVEKLCELMCGRMAQDAERMAKEFARERNA